ncbi:hypothetical protein NLI96_g9192 [Meripilus lineatus]|uniref:Protein kinase domain-containing protein n=1 Tax=Meripilus lineatus TaxID=2056292 RepID=A0AAD5UXM8_9APHY|nr:hypothetical protein NLI96_g9192 [Physisporinus lineatus]
MLACYEDTLDVIGQMCCAKYDEILSSERQQEWTRKFTNVYEALRKLECPSETIDPPGMDVIRLIPGRLKFKNIIMSIELFPESRLIEGLEQLDAWMTGCLNPLVEEMIQWYKQRLKESQEPIHEHRFPESTDNANEEKAERLKHLIGYLGLLANEGNLFQIGDEQAQGLVNLAYEVLRSRASPALQTATRPLFSKGINLNEASAYAIRRGASLFAEKTRKLPSGMKVEGVDRSEDCFSWGSFSLVYDGTLRGQRIAIKRFKLEKSSNAEIKDNFRRYICREVFMWSLLDHPNILQFYGVNDEMFGSSIPVLISPSMSQGHVTEYIQTQVVSQGLLWKLSIEIMSGLSYLHTSGIVHGNLRPPNILIGDGGHVQLADFGLVNFNSTPLADGLAYAEAQSPELAFPTMFGLPRYIPSRKADVFALGTVCWEVCLFSSWVLKNLVLPISSFFLTMIQMYTTNNPFPNYSQSYLVLRKIQSGQFPPQRLSIKFPHYVWNLITGCWKWDPSDRPEMVVLLESMSAFVLGEGEERLRWRFRTKK